MAFRTLGSIGISLVLASGTAFAQSLEEEQREAQDVDEETERLGDAQAEAEDEDPEEARDTTDPREEENEDYFFVGAFYRHVIIPSFIQQLFVVSTIDGSNPGVGLQFNWRRNNFNVSANLWWNNATAAGAFRGRGDPDPETEWVEVNLGVIFINAEFLWAFPITDWFAFELGFDLGFGFIYGDLVRTEAYPVGDGYAPCDGPGSPNGSYCETNVAPDPCYGNSGGHYMCREPNWTTAEGDVPLIFPWIAFPHLALRFKPVRQFQIRIDGGWGLYSFYFGGSMAYGF